MPSASESLFRSGKTRSERPARRATTADGAPSRGSKCRFLRRRPRVLFDGREGAGSSRRRPPPPPAARAPTDPAPMRRRPALDASGPFASTSSFRPPNPNRRKMHQSARRITYPPAWASRRSRVATAAASDVEGEGGVDGDDESIGNDAVSHHHTLTLVRLLDSGGLSSKHCVDHLCDD